MFANPSTQWGLPRNRYQAAPHADVIYEEALEEQGFEKQAFDFCLTHFRRASSWPLTLWANGSAGSLGFARENEGPERRASAHWEQPRWKVQQGDVKRPTRSESPHLEPADFDPFGRN